MTDVCAFTVVDTNDAGVVSVVVLCAFSVTDDDDNFCCCFLFLILLSVLSTSIVVSGCLVVVVLVAPGSMVADVTNLVDVTFLVTTIDLSYSSSFVDSVYAVSADVDGDTVGAL